jgi:hypothetical protein
MEENLTLKESPDVTIPELPRELGDALYRLLERCERLDFIDDFREYLVLGRINARLKQQIDEDSRCRKAMDILFQAQLDSIRQVSEGLPPAPVPHRPIRRGAPRPGRARR